MENIYANRLTIAVDNVYDPRCLSSLDSFLVCPDPNVQIASFLIDLLRNSSTNASLRVYEEENFFDIFTQMTSTNESEHTVDLYPFPLALTEDPWSYEFTGSTEWMPYFMYANARASTTSKHQSPIRFLISPFRWNTWVPFFFSILSASLVSLIVQSHHLRIRSPPSSIARASSRVPWFGLFFLFSVYTSNLKALLAQPKPLDPFHDLRDLADQMRLGERRLVLEEENTRRWRLLVDTNLTSRPDEFELLRRTIDERPETLVIADNQSHLCRLLEYEMDTVFFAYDDLVRTLCGDLCLWQYRIDEYPVIMKAIPITNMTALSAKMDVFLSAAFSYKEVLLNRLYKPRCGPQGSFGSLIGIESFYGPIILWMFGLSLGLVWFCFEIAKSKLFVKYRIYKKRSRFRNFVAGV